MNSRQIAVISAAAVIFISAYLSWKSPVAHGVRNGQNINLLLVGTDFVQNTVHSDTIVLMSYSPKNGFLDLLSVPRDTKINFAEDSSIKGVRRINEVFAYYYKKEKSFAAGLDAIRTLTTSLLHGRVDIPFYIQINYASFIKFIDIIGGVTIDVEETMKYDDSAQNLHIDIQPGMQRLNGKKALDYVRYRVGAGDIGRIYRQQRFMKAFIARLETPETILKSPQIIKFLLTEPHKNLGWWDVLCLAFELRNIDLANIRTAQLPGKPYGNFWLADDAEIDKALDAIYGIPPDETTRFKITVEVLNASDIGGAALEVTRKLRDFGFDVVEYKSLATRQPKTIVVDRVGNLRAAQAIGRVIGTEEIFTRFDSKKMTDISVYIGDDYKTRSQKN